MTNTIVEPHRQLPLTIPADQAYYWTTRWQTDEQETLASLAAGHGQRFQSADEALRYLFSSDDD